MKSRITIWSIAVVLAIPTLTMSVPIAAQDNPSMDQGHRHQQYRLIDLGTLGGPESTIVDVTKALSRHVAVGASETSVPQTSTSNFFVCQPYAVSVNISHAFVSQNDTISDLGALSPAGNNCSLANWISDNGRIAGASENGAVDPALGVNEIRAVTWNNGTLLNLGTFGGRASFAQAINNAGQVTGMALTPIPDPFSIYGQIFFGSSNSTQGRAFLWERGRMQDLGTLGGHDSWGIVINNAGEIAGNSYTNDIPNATTGLPTLDPFFWKNGRMFDAGSLGGVFSLVNDMNNRGQVVGISDLAGDLVSHAFLYDHGALHDLGTFGGPTSEARWINDSGEVVGGADFDEQFHDAVIWKHSKMIDLGNLGVTSFAHANNNSGQVVGASRIRFGSNSSATIHAFLWQNGGPMVDLNDLVPPNSSLVLEYADTISEQGVIAGTGTPAGCNDVDDGCGHAFVLIPDGYCDPDNDARMAATQARVAAQHAAAAQSPATKQDSAPLLSPAERVRNMMRQRFGLPGAHPTVRD